MSSGKAKAKAKDDLDVNEWKEMMKFEQEAIRKEQEEKRKNKMKSGKANDMDWRGESQWKSKSFIESNCSKVPKLKRHDSDDIDIWSKVLTKRLGDGWGQGKGTIKYSGVRVEDTDSGEKLLKKLRRHDASTLISSTVRGHNVRKTKKRKRKEKGKSKSNRTQKRKKNDKNKQKKKNKIRNNKTRNNKTRNNKTRNNKTRNNKTRNNKIRNNKIRNNKIRNNKIRNNKIRKKSKN